MVIMIIREICFLYGLIYHSCGLLKNMNYDHPLTWSQPVLSNEGIMMIMIKVLLVYLIE